MTEAQKNYLFDKFIESADKTLQETHLENFQGFIKTYNEDLSAIHHNITRTEEDYSTVWDSSQDPIKFDFTYNEDISWDDLINSENKLCKKILFVLANLVEEMTDMRSLV
jgi:hypothetical protein